MYVRKSFRRALWPIRDNFNLGLSSFKAKTGLLGKNKKLNKQEKESETNSKELKHRLFFTDKNEPTDEEVLEAIGAEPSTKVVSTSINEIANAAKFMKKFLDGKKADATGLPGSVLYVGSLKARSGMETRFSGVWVIASLHYSRANLNLLYLICLH